MKIGLIGIGFVGGAIRDFFIKTDDLQHIRVPQAYQVKQ